jgi:hypothetical protein
VPTSDDFANECGKKLSHHAAEMAGTLDAGAIEHVEQSPGADFRSIFMIIILLIIFVSLTPPFHGEMDSHR